MTWSKVGREKSAVNKNHHINGGGYTDVINLGNRVDAITYNRDKGVKESVMDVIGLNYCNWKQPQSVDRSSRNRNL